MSTSSLAQRRHNRPSSMFFWPTPDRPVAVRGEGIHIYDEEGRRFIDASAGPQTANIGHANPRVLAAMAEQAGKISYAFRSQFKNEPAEAFADELAEVTPKGLDMAFFASGGSEAVEAAMKLARQHAIAIGEGSRYKIVSRIPSYHGATLGALSLTGDPAMFGPFAPMMPVMPKIPAPFCAYRPAGQSAEEAAMAYADALEEAILNQGPETVLGFIMEPIGGAATGALTAPDVYYRRTAEICRRYGILLIYDEVMSGAGRSGKYLAAEHWNVVPDIVVLAKGLASGYVPLGAILASREMVQRVEQAGGFAHGHTYSASPFACAIGRAVLAEHLENDLIGNAARMGERLKGHLSKLAEQYEFIGEVRGRGLLLGFDIVADRATGRALPPELNAHLELSQAAFDRGLVIYARRVMDGRRGDNFLISPPLIVTADQVDEIAGLLGEALAAFAPKARAAIRAAG
jgi:adenosylmethionine-8-amino-7-oxononanoate aminotransferase